MSQCVTAEREKPIYAPQILWARFRKCIHLDSKYLEAAGHNFHPYLSYTSSTSILLCRHAGEKRHFSLEAVPSTWIVAGLAHFAWILLWAIKQQYCSEITVHRREKKGTMHYLCRTSHRKMCLKRAKKWKKALNISLIIWKKNEYIFVFRKFVSGH